MRKPKYLTFAKALRKHCLECSGFSSSEIKNCAVLDCACWPMRFGIKPETAEKRGHTVNPYELSGKEYGVEHLRGTYREITDEPLWWELGFLQVIRKYGLK